MNSNRKSTPAIGVPRPFNRPVQSVRQFKPAIAQLKTHVPAQSIKRPIAPPVYKPQPQQKVAQPKTSFAPVKPAVTAPSVKHPVAPPVYHRETKHTMQMVSHRLGVGQPPRAAFGRGGTIQASESKLLKQTGPSCWLFVAEAIAEQQKLDTWLLTGIMHLYPVGFMKKKDENDKSPLPKMRKATRRECLQMIKTICEDAAERFKFNRQPNVSQDQIRDMLRRSFQKNNTTAEYERCLAHLFKDPGNYNAAQVSAVLNHGAQLINTILSNLPKDAKKSSTPSILGGAPTIIAHNSKDEDIKATLRSLPNSCLSVRAFYRMDRREAQYDELTDTYDLRGLGLAGIHESETGHALLFVSVNETGLTYKDPNIGNSKIVITFTQLKEMARLSGGTISVRGMYSGSALHAALKEVKFVTPPRPVA